MRASLRHLPHPILAASVLLAAGCGKKVAGDSGASETSAASQRVEGFFNPQVGETWRYKVQREVPFEAELSREDLARRPERTESGHLITFERVRTCTGTSKPEGADKVLTTMEIFENGVLLGQELYDLAPEGVFSKGWIAAGSSSTDELLERGIALATSSMQPGEIWDSPGRDPDRRFFFRVIERTKISVPAGKFDATRIQITMDHHSKSLKRTIWFADNVGIVKEETVAYGPQRTWVRERSELLHWLVPSDAPPAEENLVPTGHLDDPSSGDDGEAPDSDHDSDQPEGDDNPGEDVTPSEDSEDSEDSDGPDPEEEN